MIADLTPQDLADAVEVLRLFREGTGSTSRPSFLALLERSADVVVEAEVVLGMFGWSERKGLWARGWGRLDERPFVEAYREAVKGLVVSG